MKIENLTTKSWEKNLLRMAHEAAVPTVYLGQENSCVEEKKALQEAYRYCSRVTAAHSRSFYIASGFLPRQKRQAVRALYAFCRVADDIVDQGSGDRREALRQFKSSILAAVPTCDQPVALAWSDARSSYRIPLRYAEQLLDGIERDLDQNRYQTFADLAVYSYGVASTVGLMSMYIIGFARSEAVAYAVRLGVALQMTNILRDIGEDWRTGRLYLPIDELHFFNLTESDLDSQRIDDRWRRFMRFQIARTRRLYREAVPGIEMLNKDGRFAVRSAASLYEDILTDIELHDYDVFSRRAHVKAPKKLQVLLSSYVDHRITK
jgi:15-cis-phytoene synthase